MSTDWTPDHLKCACAMSCSSLHELEDGRLLIVGDDADRAGIGRIGSAATECHQRLVDEGRIDKNLEAAIVIDPALLSKYIAPAGHRPAGEHGELVTELQARAEEWHAKLAHLTTERPEDYLEGKAASAILSLQAELAEATEARDSLRADLDDAHEGVISLRQRVSENIEAIGHMSRENASLQAELERVREALRQVQHGAENQGAHTGMSWRQAAELCRNALSPETQHLPEGQPS